MQNSAVHKVIVSKVLIEVVGISLLTLAFPASTTVDRRTDILFLGFNIIYVGFDLFEFKKNCIMYKQVFSRIF